MDGFDDCIIGLIDIPLGQTVICYNRRMVLSKLKKQGMTPDEAMEYHEFNQVGAYLGPGTPVFLDRYSPKETLAIAENILDLDDD